MPIEVKSRELLASLILAYTAARKGFRVYIGSHASITTAIMSKRSPGGIYLDKSTQPKSFLEFIKNKCDYICVLDYEVSPSVSRDQLKKFIPQRFYDSSPDFIDRLYVCGKESSSLSSLFFSGEKVKNVGWPKWDLYRSPLRNALFESGRIPKRGSRPYLVFASSFRYLIPPAKMIHFPKPGVIQPNDRTSLEYKEEYYRKFLIAVEELLKLDKDPDFPYVIVKPHHSESSREWRKALNGARKTFVVSHRHSLDSLIYHSSGLIHAGTSAAIHAWLMNKPLYFLPKASNASRHIVTLQLSKFLLSLDPDTSDKNKFLTTVLDNPEYSEQIMDSFLTLHQPSNSLRLTDDLISLETKHSKPLSRLEFHKQQISLRSARRAIGLIRDELLWILRRTNMGSQFHYLGTGIQSREINGFLHKFTAVSDQFTAVSDQKLEDQVKSRQIGINLVEIELKTG